MVSSHVYSKYQLQKSTRVATPVVHMFAASMGEVFACLVRVPTEIIKQRLQVGMHGSIIEAAKTVVKEEGILGMYRGLYATIFREIPFALVQFPLYEKLKASVSHYSQRDPTAYEAAFCKLSSITNLHMSFPLILYFHTLFAAKLITS